MYGYRMTRDNKLVIVPEEAEVVRWIFDMYISGSGSPAIAKILNEAGIRNIKDLTWKPKGILRLLDNEKYMGDAMMGKSVNVQGIKRSNIDGSLGERFYIEDAHEGIISKEAYYLAKDRRKRQSNTKPKGREDISHPFSNMIVCGCCGSQFRHKVNNSGTKWQNDIWSCSKREREGISHCDNTRIKDSVLREKFIEAYNEFVSLRPQSQNVDAIQSHIQKLQEQEQELASLMMAKLISEKDFRTEQQIIKTKIKEQREKIHQLQSNKVRGRDFTKITAFDETKINLFLQRITIYKNLVSFRFYNGVEITKEYTNGQPGNKPGWSKER